MSRTCLACGANISHKARAAKFCGDACRKRAQRGPLPGSHAADASPPGENRRPGPVETAVRADVEALMTAHPMGDALAEMAYTLARTLDRGAGLTSAPITRELRANLVELASLRHGDGDDLDDELSTPVRADDDEEP